MVLYTENARCLFLILRIFACYKTRINRISAVFKKMDIVIFDAAISVIIDEYPILRLRWCLHQQVHLLSFWWRHQPGRKHHEAW